VIAYANSEGAELSPLAQKTIAKLQAVS
jgi:formate dehydrogenase subunit delta